MSDSTSIASLPAPITNEPKQVQQLNQNNIKMEVKEQIQKHVTQQPQKHNENVSLAPQKVDPNGMNRVISGIQQAQMQGMTQLPSRDIPMNTNQLTQDNQIQPNYVPDKEKKDYIEEEDTYESLLQKKKEKMEQEDRLDMLYNEMQMPLLIMVLFFIFQMPFTKKKLLHFFPSMFKKDGNMTMSGYLLKTSLFGLSFYTIMKLSNYASEI
tara:strand:- start:570 stop:1199 length:630 start_codon:yes stop_codon:yes gene_type:complete